MKPKAEAEWEERITSAGRLGWLAYLRFVGEMRRACILATEAEADGVVGASRLLGNVPAIDPAAVERLLMEPVRLGLLTEEEAARAFRGQE